MRRSIRAAVSVCLLSAMLAGCNVAGPTAIRSGRQVYNEAITATNNLQVLALIVKLRYGENAGLLAVSSVTANIRVAGNVSADIGIGADRNFAGNLVPLSVGVAYEENPTISYVPLEGERYVRELFAPLPIDLTVLLLNGAEDPGEVLLTFTSSVNGIANPAFLRGDATPDPQFTRLCELMTELGHGGQLFWTQQPKEEDSDERTFAVVLHRLSDDDATAREFLSILGLDPPTGDYVSIPVVLGVGRVTGERIQIATRSLADIFHVAGAAVEVAEEHLESGLAPASPPTGDVGQLFRIRAADRPPDTAFVAYEHRGCWYYVDATDTKSKQFFRMITTLITVRLADTAGSNASRPVLTVPVSR
jgi:hypothetical protein